MSAISGRSFLRFLTEKGQGQFAVGLFGMARLLGSAADGPPVAADDAVVAEALDVFGEQSDGRNTIRRQSWNGSVWQSWQSIGGTIH
jgi:hypothetical protein